MLSVEAVLHLLNRFSAIELQKDWPSAHEALAAFATHLSSQHSSCAEHMAPGLSLHVL